MSTLIMNTSEINNQGFTLIELAIVLVIVAILAGGFLSTLGARIENTKRTETLELLNEINDSILGFAITNGRIPCPTTPTGGGQEQPVGGGVCTAQHGFVPGRTLGLQGSYNQDGLLLDSWSNPVRYSVTIGSVSAFTTPPGIPGSNIGIRGVGIGALNPDLVICDGDSAAGTTCSAGLNTHVDNTPYIILSLGKDGSDFVGAVKPNSDQGENSGEAQLGPNAAGENITYLVGVNRVFVSKVFSSVGSASGLYDDIILWESPFIIYTKMIEAGQIP